MCAPLPDWEDACLQDREQKLIIDLDDETDGDLSCLLVEKKPGKFTQCIFFPFYFSLFWLPFIQMNSRFNTSYILT